MRILVKCYLNELLEYLILSFTSIPVIANDKDKPECIFPIVKCFFYVETATKRKQNDSISKSFGFNEIVCL